MNVARTYQNYSDSVKEEIARTGNVYAFPHLKIPRTTAQYWVKRHKLKPQKNIVETDSLYKQKAEYLADQLAKESSLRCLLETVRKLFPYDFQNKHLKSRVIRSKIILAIRECIKHNKLSKCLSSIGLSKSAYQRWSSEISFCIKTKNLCQRRSAFQLTDHEVATMKKYVTTKKFAHISIASLHLLAQRTGALFCSLDTWYKYINCFEWKRPWKLEKKRIQKIGIRASRPNEIWHLDVSVVNVRPGYKLYIQAVIDNFSRFILAWRVTDVINAKNTIETLNLAKAQAEKISENVNSTEILMDPGSENNNTKVLHFITSKNLIRTLAQVDVHYSNSMIESLFRLLKNNYLYHQGINTVEDLTRKCSFYFKEHNEVIPLAVHGGGRPKEVYTANWNDKDQSLVKKNKEHAKHERKKKNLQPACSSCPTF